MRMHNCCIALNGQCTTVDTTIKSYWRYSAIVFIAVILNGCCGSIVYYGSQYELNNVSLQDSINTVTYQSKLDYAKQLCPYGVWPSLMYMSILTKGKTQAALDSFPKGGIVEILTRNRSVSGDCCKLMSLKIYYEHSDVAYNGYRVYEHRVHYCTCSELMDTHTLIQLVDSLRDDICIKLIFVKSAHGDKSSIHKFQNDSCKIRRVDR
jgi:hypothetical protein